MVVLNVFTAVIEVHHTETNKLVLHIFSLALMALLFGQLTFIFLNGEMCVS